MEFKEIIELINAISDSKVTSFTLEEGDKKLTIKAGDKAPQIIQVPTPVAMPASVQNLGAVQMPQGTSTSINIADNIIEAKSEETAVDKNFKPVTSPLVGTFYAAPSPEDKPFISVGDTVKKGQVIGIVEAMKLMNEIESEHDGVVTEIMVNNGDSVEYGQTLVKIK